MAERFTEAPRVVVMTPVKNAAHEAPGYVDRLLQLDYPAAQLSLGVLVSDSDDGSVEAFTRNTRRLSAAGWNRVTVVQRDFGYRIPAGRPRWAPEIQVERRTVLAKSRNHLLFAALGDAEWVLWLDADVVEFAPEILRALLATHRSIVHPNCVLTWGGKSFDLNAWTDGGRRHLHDLRGGAELVELESVGGTMLLVRADLHRDGLVFPAYLYGNANSRVRHDAALTGRDQFGEIETEGLAVMAFDMGERIWGLPGVEIRHRDR